MAVRLPDVIEHGLLSARPAAGSAGRLYFTSDAAPGRVYRDDGVDWVELLDYQIYELPFYLPGKPAAGAVVCKQVFRQQVAFVTAFGGSAGAAPDVNPTLPAVFDVQKGGASVGSISIAATGAYTFTTSGGTPPTFNAGDVLTIVAPTPQDATLEGAAWTLAGTKV